MCQLLGMNCNTPTDIGFSFAGFRQRGGLTDHHEDGFGIAFFEKTEMGGIGLRQFHDDKPSHQSPVADLINNYPIRAMNVIAHIRKATTGGHGLANIHPFVREVWGEQWAFAHNGQMTDSFVKRTERQPPVHPARAQPHLPGLDPRHLGHAEAELRAPHHPIGDQVRRGDARHQIYR